MLHRTFAAVLFLFLLLLCPALASAQTTNATLTGFVTDPQRALVVGAKVVVINADTNLRYTATTNQEGSYTVPNLPPGNYKIEVEKQGFKTIVKPYVVLHAQDAIALNFDMAIGSASESITVTGSAGAVVETRSATLGEVVAEKQIIELPLNERNFLNLATLQAGVVPAVTITSNNTPAYPGGVQSVFEVNGLRLQSNNFLLDGADNNEPFLGTAMSTPSPDALEEFKILTNNFSAEFGGGGGSIVNIITRQGTNKFRGTLYDFFRNDFLDARNPFAQTREKLRRNQFGASFGGPIIRDKTFFFANYEGFRLREGITRVATVPTLAQRGGNFGTFTIAPGNFDPVAVNLLPLIPLPIPGTNRFVSSPVSSNDANEFTVRGDHAFSSKNYLSGRYHFSQGQIGRNFTNTLFGISIDLPNFPLEDDYRLQNLAVADTHFFSPTFTNEGRFAFNRGRFDSAISKTIRSPASFGFNLPATKPQGNMPLIAIAGFTALGTFNDSPSFRREDVFQYQDTLSYIHGKHALKGGFNFENTHMDIPSSDSIGEGAFLFVGAATGNAFADFLTGQPFLFFQGGGITARDWRFSSYDFFFQDEYHLRPNFTVTLGLRYELPIPPVDTKNRVVALRPGQQSTVNPTAPLGLLFVGDTGITRSTITTAKNNFAPRIGLAWDVRGNGKYSVRAAYGIFYDRLIGLIPFQFGLDPPFDIIPAIPRPFIPSFGNPFNGMSPFQGRTAQQVAAANIFPLFSFLQIMDPKNRTPYVQQWNLTGQWQVLKDTVVQVAYVGSKSTKLPEAVEINSARPTRPFAPAFLQVSSYRTSANASYHALQITANKSIGNGLSLLASYTWSKSIDDASHPVNFLNPSNEATFPQDRLNLAAERGRSAYDARHRFILSALYELPFLKNRNDALGTAFGNWQVNGIITQQTGFPFTVLDSSDPNRDGDATDRPDIVGNPFAGTSTPSLFFNPAAFAHPAPGNDGNAGRNILSGPGIANVDFSVFKNFPWKETRSVQFRAEFFNLFNHANFNLPVNDINSPNAGAILSTRLPSRQIQLALKINF